MHVVTHGQAARFATIAGAITRYPTHENQSKIFHAAFPLVGEACQALAPDPATIESMSADDIEAARRAVVQCWWEAYEANPPTDPTEEPPPPPAYEDEPKAYLGASAAGTDGPSGGCTPVSGNYKYWSGKYYLTNVKQQGRRGSCVAFSTVSALENSIARKLGKWVNLSEQDLYAQAKVEWFEEDFYDGLPTQDVIDEMYEEGFGVAFEKTWNYNPSWSRVDREVAEDLGYWKGSCTDYTGPACSNTAHQAKTVCTNVGGSNTCYWWMPKSPGGSA